MQFGETLAGTRTPPYTVAPLPPFRAPVSLLDEPKIQGIGDEGYPPQAVPEEKACLQEEASEEVTFEEEAGSQEEAGEEVAFEEEAGSQEEAGEEVASEEEAGSQEETGEEVASEEEAGSQEEAGEEVASEEEAGSQEEPGKEAASPKEACSEGEARPPKGTDHKEAGCDEKASAPGISAWALGRGGSGQERRERVRRIPVGAGAQPGATAPASLTSGQAPSRSAACRSAANSASRGSARSPLGRRRSYRYEGPAQPLVSNSADAVADGRVSSAAQGAQR